MNFLILSFAVSLQILPGSISSAAAGYYKSTEAQCSPIDYRETFPLKMRNQKDIAWCFAHATADNLQFTEKTNIQISAADIAINYSKSGWSRILGFFKRLTSSTARMEPNETGLAKYAAQRIIPQGYCPEEYFPSEEWTRVSQDGTQKQVQIYDAAPEIYALQKKVRGGLIRSGSDLPYSYQFKQINRDQFFEILKTKGNNAILEKMRVTACHGQRIPFQTRMSVDMDITNPRIFSNMNQELQKGESFSIDFFSRIMLNIDAPVNIKKGFHTTMIMGRKFDKDRNECRYLMKNSYGDSCNWCQKEVPATGCVPYDPRLNCEHGYYWMPESTLHKTMTSIVSYHKL